jgi:hypothetical protein
MSGLVSIVVMTASMLVLGWLVWTNLQRQESRDEAFQRKLADDDARAAEGRGLDPRTASASAAETKDAPTPAAPSSVNRDDPPTDSGTGTGTGAGTGTDRG